MASWKRVLIFGSMGAGVALYVSGRRAAGTALAGAGIGGLIGVSIAWAMAVAVRSFTSFPMEVPINAVVIGVVLSTVVGLFFGIYPARRASRLDPIVALRAEN